MAPDTHVLLRAQMDELRAEAEGQKKDTEISGCARYQESLIKILDQLLPLVKSNSSCKTDRWIAIEKRITETAQKDACCGEADVAGIMRMISAEDAIAEA